MRRLAAFLVLLLSVAAGQELRFCLRSEPATLDPLKVDDEYSDLIRYLTGGMLVRMNRATQQPEPDLATGWHLSKDAREITLDLRRNVRFSDGSPFDSADVVHTFKLLFAPDLHSSLPDSFRVGGNPPVVRAKGAYQVTISFSSPNATVVRLLDQLAIQSSRTKGHASLGPYVVTEHKQGSSLTLDRNPNYWKPGKPGIQKIQIRIQPNRELEALALRRGEIDLISSIDSRTYDDLSAALPGEALDIGPSLNQEFLWFNQSRSAPVKDARREWFRNSEFRKAVSMAINRPDLCRVVYKGHAIPAAGPYSPANRTFGNSGLKPVEYDPNRAKQVLAQAGFRLEGGTLKDAHGNPVTFSLMTNSSNRARTSMAAMIQRDLKAIGITMNIVTLDFPALLERLGKTHDYEACLFGLIGTADPGNEMDFWLSSGPHHQWNPSQPKPETSWEAEIDTLMQQQSVALSEKQRKAAFDRLQHIVREQQPIIYLVHPNALAAVSPRVKGVKPAVLLPQLLWNVDQLQVIQ